MKVSARLTRSALACEATTGAASLSKGATHLPRPEYVALLPEKSIKDFCLWKEKASGGGKIDRAKLPYPIQVDTV